MATPSATGGARRTIVQRVYVIEDASARHGNAELAYADAGGGRASYDGSATSVLGRSPAAMARVASVPDAKEAPKHGVRPYATSRRSTRLHGRTSRQSPQGPAVVAPVATSSSLAVPAESVASSVARTQHGSAPTQAIGGAKPSRLTAMAGPTATART